jgi:hypothetical protein
MQTKKMKDFIDKNNSQKIVFGERLTPEGKTIFTAEDMKRSDRILYRFSDRTTATLTFDDIKSAPDFEPAWDLS